jgi:hypothetical protein
MHFIFLAHKQTKALNAVNKEIVWNEKIDFKSSMFTGDQSDLAKKLIVFHMKEKDV